MADKALVSITILLFWLVLPAVCMLAGVAGYDFLTVDISGLEGLKEIPLVGGFLFGAGAFVATIASVLLVYIQVFTFHIPFFDSVPYVSYLVNALQIVSALVLFLLWRGN